MIIDFVNVYGLKHNNNLIVIINHFIGQNFFPITNIVISSEFLREDIKLVMFRVSHITNISK